MTWLDSVCSAPTIGINLSPRYNEVFEFQKRASKFFDFIIREDEAKIETIEIWGYRIITNKLGFRFNISPSNILVNFAYKILQTDKPGHLPSYNTPELEPYSELLKKSAEYTKKIIENLDGIIDFKYNRIGIVAHINLDKESIPPGVNDWINKLGETLKKDIVKSETTLLVNLEENEDYIKRCHHILNFDTTRPDTGFILNLDWQKLYKKPHNLNKKELNQNLEICIDEAMVYFEKFGEGGINDE